MILKEIVKIGLVFALIVGICAFTRFTNDILPFSIQLIIDIAFSFIGFSIIDKLINLIED